MEDNTDTFSIELLKKKLKEEKKVGSVDLSHQGLARLPEELLHSRGAKVLQCDFNYISILPSGFCSRVSGTLTRLSLHSNRLSTLPWEFSLLSKLRLLELSYNYLTTLPHPLARLTQLEELIIQWNDISALPSHVIGALCNLQVLDLHGN